jgi:hypothetical protein
MITTQSQIDAYISELDIFVTLHGPQEWGVSEEFKESFARFMLQADDYLSTHKAECVPYWVARKLMELIDSDLMG